MEVITLTQKALDHASKLSRGNEKDGLRIAVI